MNEKQKKVVRALEQFFENFRKKWPSPGKRRRERNEKTEVKKCKH